MALKYDADCFQIVEQSPSDLLFTKVRVVVLHSTGIAQTKENHRKRRRKDGSVELPKQAESVESRADVLNEKGEVCAFPLCSAAGSASVTTSD